MHIDISSLGLHKKITERASRVFRECGFDDVKKLKRDVFDAWLEKLKNEATRTSYRSAISSVGAKLVESGLIKRNPFANKDRQIAGAKARVPLPGDFDALIDEFCAATGKNVKNTRTSVRKTAIKELADFETAKESTLDKVQLYAFRAFHRWLIDTGKIKPVNSQFDIFVTQCRETWHHVVFASTPRKAFDVVLSENPIVAGSRSPVHLVVKSQNLEFHITAKSLHDAGKRAERGEIHFSLAETRQPTPPGESLTYWPFSAVTQAVVSAPDE